MTLISRMVLIAGVLMCLPLTPVQANFLTNTDLQNRLQGWHGDATVAYLKADGTEGSETDKDVTPVIKLKLSRGSCRMVIQEYSTHDPLTELTVQVEVFPSKDFVRSKYPTDYNQNWRPGTTYWTSDSTVVPTADFWIRGGGSTNYYSMFDLKPNQWQTIKATFKGMAADQKRAINFFVPPGTGVVYLKNPSVEK